MCAGVYDNADMWMYVLVFIFLFLCADVDVCFSVSMC